LSFRETQSVATMDLSPQQFDRLRAYVRRVCGLALGDDKAYLVRQRLGPVAEAAGCADFGRLADLLEGPAPVWLRDEVVEAITTHETSFFRDGHPFDTFRTVLLPELLAVRRPVRIWCAGAATGQEPYSLAMCLLECPGATGSILATDVSARALADAAAGVYAAHEVRRGLPAALRDRYFEARAGGWAVGDRLRRLVEFRRRNLIEPFDDLGPLDAAFCRNVLMYFDPAIRQRVCDGLFRCLRPGGILCLGAAESLFGLAHAFEAVAHGATVVYRKAAAE
jgi:chemotaxis protein methyltransferase CheR